MRSEEVAKRLIKIDEKLYRYLTRFNELKQEHEEIISFAEKNGINAELKAKMEKSISEFEEVLKVIKELEEQTNRLKKKI